MDIDPNRQREVEVLWEQLRKDVQRRGLDEQSAEDVVQETWLRTLRRPPSQGEKLGGWLNVVSSRLVHELRRSRRNRSSRERSVARPERVDFDDESTDSLVRRYVDELGSPYAEVLVLRFYEDLDVLEIAAELERSPATVRSQLSRGLERLRQRLEAPGSRRAPSWFFLWLRRRRASASSRLRWLAAAGVVLLGGAALWIARSPEPAAVLANVAVGDAGASAAGAPEPTLGRREVVLARESVSAPATRPIEHSIEGFVFDAAGAVQPGAEIRAGDLRGEGRALTVADGQGRYRALGLAANEYLWALGPDGQVSSRCYAASVDASGVQDLHLARSSGTLFLQVFEPDGRPAVGLRVALDGELGRGATTAVTTSGGIEVPLHDMRSDVTDAAGRLTLSVPDRRLLALEARRDGRPVANERIHVPDGESSVTWTLPRPAVLTGTVRDAGAGLRPDARVRVRRGQEIMAEVPVGPDGRFEIPDLAPGRFNAAAFVPSDPDAPSHGLHGTLEPGERMELAFELDPLHSVRGRVIEDGKPLAGALVHGYVEDRDMLPPFESTLTDDAGAFQFPGIAPDALVRFEVIARGDVLPTAWKGAVRAGEGEVVIERTAATSTLHAVVVEFVGGDPARPPTLLSLRCLVPRVSVELPVDAASLRAEARLPAGEYLVSAWVPGVGVWNAKERLLAGSEDRQRVLLPRPGELVLELELPDDVPATAVDVQVRAGNLVPFGIDGPGSSACLHATLTDPLCRIHRAALFPGKARTYVRVPGFADVADEVRVNEGERTSVRIVPVRGFDVWLRIDSARGFLPSEGVGVWLESESGTAEVTPPPDSMRSEIVTDPSDGPGTMEMHLGVPLGTKAIEVRTRLGQRGRVELAGAAPGKPLPMTLRER